MAHIDVLSEILLELIEFKVIIFMIMPMNTLIVTVY